MIRNTKIRKLRFLVALGLIVILTPIALFTLYHPGGTEAGWWNDGWRYRKKIPITAHTSEENNVYIEIAGYDASDTTRYQADCGDMRFTRQNGELLPYYVSSCGASTTIHINFDVFPAGAQDIYIYYGNPAAENGFSSSDFSTEATNYTLGTIASEETTPGPVGYWKFDEGTGQAINDTSSNRNDGMLGSTVNTDINDPSWAPEDLCVSGKCLEFDGTDDSTNMGTGASLDGTTNFSVAAWIKTGSATEQLIVQQRDSTGFNGEYWFKVLNSGLLNFFVYGDSSSQCSVDSTSVVNDNRWHHVMAIRNGNSLVLYVDGNQENSCNGSAKNLDDSLSVIIGRDTRDNNKPFNGFIDEVKIYPYARSADQILADYNQYANVLGLADQKNLSDGLVGYWAMDETSWSGTSGEVLDKSGNGNNGTAVNGATTAAGKFGNGGSFDGSDDYIAFSSGSALGLDATFSSWIKLSGTPSHPATGIVKADSNSNSYLVFEINDSKRLRFELRDEAAINGGNYILGTGSTVLSTDTWYMVSIVLNRKTNTASLYINGILDSTIDISNAPLTIQSRPSAIGRHVATFPGTIDETRIYNRALSPSEVKQLYEWAPGPVGYWDFNERTGTNAYDRSGNNLTASFTSMDSSDWVTGQYGGGLNFDDNSDYLEKTDSGDTALDLTSHGTISVWAKSDRAYPSDTGSDDYRAFVTKASGGGAGAQAYVFHWQGSDSVSNLRLCLADGVSSFCPNTNIGALDTSSWYHFAVSWDTSNVYWYVNGKLVETDTNTLGAAQKTDDNLTIGGKAFNSAALGWDGKMDDVKIYNYARTPEQIRQDMEGINTATGGDNLPTPVAHWRFDEGQGQTAHDNAGSNDGTLGADGNASTDDPSWKTSSDCKVNGCLSFDGGSDSGHDYVELTNFETNFFRNNSFSVSTWAMRSDSRTQNTILSYRTDSYAPFSLSFRGTRVRLQAYDSSNTVEYELNSSSGSTVVDQWYHVTGTFDNEVSPPQIKLYIDGSLVDSVTCASCAVDSTTQKLAIGRDYWNGSMYGKVDELKIYNSALSAEQVRQDMNQSKSVVVSASQEADDISDGAGDPPVAQWNFDEKTGGYAEDTSGNGNRGTITGATWTSGCKIGACLSFDGVDDFISMTELNSTKGSAATFTIEAWVKPNGTYGIDRAIFGSQPSRRNNISITSATNLSWGTYNTSDGIVAYNWTIDSFTDSWNHLSLVVDLNANTATLYQNGVNKGINIVNISTLDHGIKYIGGQGIGLEYFDGQIDQVKIYDYARTPAQIAYDYNRGGPIAHYRFDECEGTTIYDVSGNENNGTLTIGGSGEDTVGTCNTSSTAWGSGVNGKYASSMSFDGSDDKVDINSTLGITTNTNLTIANWVYLSDTSESGAFVKIGSENASNDGFAIGVGSSTFDTEGNDLLLLFEGVRWVDTNTTIGTGWHHVAMTVNSSGLPEAYLDGKSLGTFSGTIGDAPDSGDSTKIGGYTGSGAQNRFGNYLIDDVQIFNYALSAAQIKKLYNGGFATFFNE